MKIGYFTNQYPAVSHSFIRREIRAIEALGMSVQRYALRPMSGLVDPDDHAEQQLTRYVLQAGAVEIARCLAVAAFLSPLKAARAFALAVKIGWRSDRGILRHLGYLLEAVVLADWSRRDAIDHLHAHFGTNAAAIAMLAWCLSGIRYSFTAHGPDEFERAPLLSLDTKLEHAAFVVCVSAFGRSQYMRWTPSSLWHKIVIIHCGLDSAFFDCPAQPVPAAPRLVCIGRLSEQKAQLILIEAARGLRDAGVTFELVLGGDGPLRRQIEDAVAQFGLQRQVTITGWISGPAVRREIEASRALVLPSFAENMPVVIMEALVLRRPVISTYIAGIPELVQDRRTGWLVPAGDIEALTLAMREALEAPIERLTEMGNAGRAHVLKEHDATTEAKKLISLFKSGVATTGTAKSSQ